MHQDKNIIVDYQSINHLIKSYIMKVSTILFIIASSSTLLFSACKKEGLEGAGSNGGTVKPGAGDTAITVTPPTIFKRTLNLGTGSGNLTIDGTTLALQCNDLIKIKGGSYTNIDIKNILSADGCPITIKNDGLVEVAGDFNQMSLTNIKNVTISGDGTTGIAKGFVFRDNKYRAIQAYGSLDKFTLQFTAFRNIGDTDFSFQYKAVYNGSDASYSKGLKLLNISCDNTSTFFSTSGSVENGVVTGLIKGLEIANLDFENSPGVGVVVYTGNIEDYDIHNNRINNINTTNNNHNGIFSMSGNGRFHDNYVSNHQGNAIRAWGFSVGTTPKNIYIYNNIVVNSRKYSGFEVQAFATSITPGISTFTNAVVFNNTCGNLNTSDDWQGNVVDVYSLQGGKCDVYNNLGYNFQTGSVIAGQENDLIPNAFSNLYYKSASDAGLVDQTSFKLTSNSPAKNKGTKAPFVITDYYGSMRNITNPSVGAVE